jgi:hypothetical protein
LFGQGKEGAETLEAVRSRVAEALRDVKSEEEGVPVKERVHWGQLVLKVSLGIVFAERMGSRADFLLS